MDFGTLVLVHRARMDLHDGHILSRGVHNLLVANVLQSIATSKCRNLLGAGDEVRMDIELRLWRLVAGKVVKVVSVSSIGFGSKLFHCSCILSTKHVNDKRQHEFQGS